MICVTRPNFRNFRAKTRFVGKKTLGSICVEVSPFLIFAVGCFSADATSTRVCSPFPGFSSPNIAAAQHFPACLEFAFWSSSFR